MSPITVQVGTVFECNYPELKQLYFVNSCFQNTIEFTEGAYSWYTFTDEILRFAPTSNSEVGTYNLAWTDTETIIG